MGFFFQKKIFNKNKLASHILTKYLLKDLFLYFFVAFLFFFMIFFVNQILLDVEKLLAASAPFADVMKIMFYSLPFIIAQSSPFATLVGFLMSLGGMMSNNEILIFRAAGFSFFRLLGPIIFMGVLISVVSFFVNDYLIPLGTIKYNKLFREILSSKPTIELEENSVKSIGNSYIVMGDVEGENVSDIILFDEETNSEKIIIAGNSSLVGAKSEGVIMQLKMDDATVVLLDKKEKENFEVITSEKTVFNVFDSIINGSTSHSAREMTTYDLVKEIHSLKENITEDSDDKYRLNLWEMEFHKKFSLPFGSVFFAFLAFSIAFIFGKHNGQTIGLFVGLVICVLYWAMQIMGQLFVLRVGLDSFWCIWVSNFVIGFFGIIFFIILIRK